MRKAISSAVLLLALTLSARAGEIPTPASPTPPSTVSTQAAGEIPNPQPTEESAAQVVLRLLESVLALF